MADTPKKEGILQKLPPIIPPVISDFVKEKYNKEGIFRTMSKPYVEVYKGMTDPEYRYDNFPKTYEEYIDRIIVNEDGINRSSGKDRDYYLNHEPTYREFIKQKNMRANPAMASKLSGESGLARAGRGIINAGADAALLAAILPGETFTMENIGKLRRDYVVDEEMAAEYGYTVDEANQIIRKHDDMANLGYFGALAASLPIEDILFRAAGSGLMKGGKFAGKKTGELLSDLKYLDEPDAGSLFLNTAKTKPSSLGAASAKSTVNIDEANKAAAYHSGGTKTYTDYITVNPDGTPARGTNSQHYLRKQFMKAGKVRDNLDITKFKPQAIREEQSKNVIEAHKEYRLLHNDQNPSASQLDRFLTRNYAMPEENRKLIRKMAEDGKIKLTKEKNTKRTYE